MHTLTYLSCLLACEVCLQWVKESTDFYIKVCIKLGGTQEFSLLYSHSSRRAFVSFCTRSLVVRIFYLNSGYTLE